MTTYKQGTERIDTDFEYKGKDYWYVADADYNHAFSEAILWGDDSCPAEEELTLDIDIQELNVYDAEGNEHEVKLSNLDLDLKEAIEADIYEQMKEMELA